MLSRISFILDGNVVEIDMNTGRYSPTTTVFQYLRTLPHHHGTKEGCAEGDCGACTVVLGERDDSGAMHYRSVDSCLVFLPMIHGKQLITVENLVNEHGELHPVQRAMVETGGSQCGYCTPGFIMSLFSLYKEKTSLSRCHIDDALTGNLCRCTGYKPIVEAASRSCVIGALDDFSKNERHLSKLVSSIPQESIVLENSTQRYYRPLSLGEAITLKHRLPKALIVSGATDVALRITKQHELLPEIIDLSGVKELQTFEETNDSFIIGSGLSLNELMQKIQNKLPALYEMLNVFGSRQIRNVATLGGNLGTASPIGDTLPVLMAYDARVVLEGLNGRREIAANDYFTGYRQTVRKPDEIITSVVISRPATAVRVKAYKVSKRKDLDISSLSGGFSLELDNARTVTSILLAYGGMAERPKRAFTTERFLTGKKWERSVIEEAMTLIGKEFSPLTDVRASSEFRMAAAKNLLLKFWSETHD